MLGDESMGVGVSSSDISLEGLETGVAPCKVITEQAEPDVVDRAKVVRLSRSEVVARSFVLRPRTWYFSMWAGILSVTALVIGMGWLDIQELGPDDYKVADAQETLDERALVLARAAALSSLSSGLGNSTADAEQVYAVRSEAAFISAVAWVFEWADESRTDTVLTRLNVQRMCVLQRTLVGQTDFPLLCWVAEGAEADGYNTMCRDSFATNVVARFYPGLAAQRACALLDEASFATSYDGFMGDAVGNAFFFPKADPVDPSTQLTKLRSFIELGGPLGADTPGVSRNHQEIIVEDGFFNSGEQWDAYYSFLVDHVNEELQGLLGMEPSLLKSAFFTDGALLDAGDGDMRVRFYSKTIETSEFTSISAMDQILAAGAALVVGIMMWINVRSLFVTVNAMLAIVFTVPVGLFLYAGVLGIRYFTSVHMIVLFLVLGIGADSIFVQADMFRQSERLWHSVRGIASEEEAGQRNVYGTGRPELEVLVARVAYTYRKSVKVVAETSFTTFAAFVATGVSPIGVIAAFGFFAAMVMLVVFLWTVLLYPSFLVIDELYFRRKPFCCACLRRPLRSASRERGLTHSSAGSDEDSMIVAGQGKAMLRERVFTDYYVPAMTQTASVWRSSARVRPLPLFCVAALLVVFGVLGSSAVELDTPKERENTFAPGHMMRGLLDVIYKEFNGASFFSTVDLVWGIDGLDTTSAPRFGGNFGDLVLRADFDPSSRQAQEYILATCDELRGLSCVPAGASAPLEGCSSLTGTLVPAADVDCTLERFIHWHDVLTFPNETTALDLGDENRGLWAQRLRAFSIEAGVTDNVGFIDGRLAFLVVPYTTTLPAFDVVARKLPVFDLLDDFLERTRAAAPQGAGLDSVLHTSREFWWTQTELGMKSGLLQGMAIALPIAFLVLLVASNLVVALFGTFSVLAVVAFVLGCAQYLGFGIGIGTGIAATFVIGLSVDFVIHASASFVAVGEATREQKFTVASETMGPTILAAGMTTFASGCVMFLCSLDVFFVMATLITLTIAASVTYALLFFLPLCLLLAPEKARRSPNVNCCWTTSTGSASTKVG